MTPTLQGRRRQIVQYRFCKNSMVKMPRANIVKSVQLKRWSTALIYACSGCQAAWILNRFIREKGVAAYRELLAKAPTYLDFLVDQALKMDRSTAEGKLHSGTGSNGPSSLPCSTPQARYTSMLLATTTRPARPWNVSINDSACMPELRIRSMTTSAFGRRVGKSRRSPRID